MDRPPPELMLMTEQPPSESFMYRFHASCVHTSGALMFTSTVFSQRPASTSMVRPKYGLAAALFTRMSTAPNPSIVASTQASACSGSPTFEANHWHAVTDLGGRRLAGVGLPRRDHDLCPGFGERRRDALADALRPAGHQRRLAVESEVHGRRRYPGTLPPVNRLAHETSPYLRQHGDNPVDWYPWGDGGVRARRRRADMPVLLSRRLLGLPLVPRDGPRVLRGRRPPPRS